MYAVYKLLVCSKQRRYLYRSLIQFRVIHNSRTHFTKSVHLKGGKDFNMRPTHRKWNSPSLFVRSAGASFIGDHQGSRSKENGGDGSSEDEAPFRWPPRSPNLMPCDLKIMAKCYGLLLPLLQQDLPQLWRRNIAAVSEIDRDMLRQVCAEMDYRLDVCRATKCGYIHTTYETLWVRGRGFCFHL